jgi:hypothetical protein
MTFHCYSIFADAFGKAKSVEACTTAALGLLHFGSARRIFKPSFPGSVSAVQDLK